MSIAGCALGLVCAATAAWGAPAPLSGALNPNAGPNQQPLPVPPYAQPRPSLAPPPPAGISAPSGPPGAAFLLSDVQVDSGKPRQAVRPRTGWRPQPTAPGGLGLVIERGEQMDGAWVRRQFEANGLIGSQTTSDRIVALVVLINQAYAQNGYINSGVVFSKASWATDAGVLKLRLIYGGLARSPRGRAALRVAWARGGSQGMRASYIEDRLGAARQSPLNVVDLEREFRLLADDPAIRTINAQLIPGAAPGEAELSLDVAPQPLLDVYAGVANSRNPSVGAVRGYGGFTVRNVPFSGDVLAADLGETSGLFDAVVDYATPFLSPQATLDVQALYDGAAVVDPAVRRLDIKSTERSFEAGLTAHVIAIPLVPIGDGGAWSPAQALDFGVRIAQRRSSSTLNGVPFSFTPGAVNGVTDLTALRLVSTYVTRSQLAALAASATVSIGLAGTGSDILGIARPDPHFRAVLLQANYAHKLIAGLQAHARLSAQWSNGLLYSMERFSVGGEDTVRGYRENLLLADEGVVGSVELVCPITPGKGPCSSVEDWRTLRLAVFADGAHVHNRIAPQPVPPNLASIGVSVSWAPSPALFARISYGYALIRSPQSGPLDLEDRGVSFLVTVHPGVILQDWKPRSAPP